VYGLGAPARGGFAFGLQPDAGPCCSCRSSASLTGFGFRVVRRGDRGGGQDDRQLQLRHERGADADVSSWRERFLPDLESPGRARARPRSSTRCTTACSWYATRSLGGLGPADLGHAAVLLGFAVVMWRIAVWQLGKRPDRLTLTQL